MEIKVGVSTATLFPWTLMPGVSAWIINNVWEEHGIGTQLLPLTALGTRELGRLNPDAILSFEGAWNEGKAPKTDREVMLQLLKHPTDLGPWLFWSQNHQKRIIKAIAECFPDAWPIDTTYAGRLSLLEISGDNWDTFLAYLNRGGGGVWDSWHCRGNNCSQEADSIGRERTIKILKEHADGIKVIHLQTRDKKELEKFLTGEENFLSCFLREMLPLAQDGGVPVIIEWMPWQAGIAEVLKTRDRILDIVG